MYKNPWEKPIQLKTYGIHSSWVEAIRWIPQTGQTGIIEFLVNGKWYSISSMTWSVWLILSAPENIPFAGVGSDLWGLGVFKGSNKRNKAIAKGRIKTRDKLYQQGYLGKKGKKSNTLNAFAGAVIYALKSSPDFAKENKKTIQQWKLKKKFLGVRI